MNELRRFLGMLDGTQHVKDSITKLFEKTWKENADLRQQIIEMRNCENCKHEFDDTCQEFCVCEKWEMRTE